MAEPAIPPTELTVLIADDHGFIRNLVEGALDRQLPVRRIIHTADGIAALLELGVVLTRRFDPHGDIPRQEDINVSSSPVDLLITGFHMSGVNGLHILKMIRTGLTGVPRDTPVVMLTGDHDHALLAAALALDVDSFINKPVAAVTLKAQVIGALLGRTERQPVEVYARVALPDLDTGTAGLPPESERLETISLRRPPPDGSPAPLRPPPQPEPATRCVPLDELEAGSVLSEDIISNSQRVLLTKQTVLTGHLVQRLTELSEITGVHAVRVFVSED